MKVINKIIIGTAQFGKKYGISNTYGKLEKKEIYKILDYCKCHKIVTFDYASSYFDNNYINFYKKKYNFNFIVKLKSRFFLDNDLKKIAKKIKEYKKNFSNKIIECLMIHDDFMTFSKKNPHFINQIKYLKKNKFFKKFGFSIYSEKELITLKKYYDIIDVIQLPINIFDQRFLKKKYLNIFKKYNIEIHARSIFLQGSLISNKLNGKLKKYKKYYKKFSNFCATKNISKIYACLNFVANQKNVNKIIIGFDSYNHLNQIVSILKNLKKKKIIKISFDVPKKLIDPRKW